MTDTTDKLEQDTFVPWDLETAKQEIKDLFSRYGSGDYTPTEEEKEIIDNALDEILTPPPAFQPSSDGPFVRWLIEHGSPAEFLEDYEPGKSSPVWTKDAYRARMFLSQSDADALATMLHPSFKARVCDHMFNCGPYLPSASSPLERFGLAVLEEHRNEITDLDGGWIQDKAVELGLLAGVTVVKPCSEQYCKCAEYGDFPQECLRETDVIRAKMAEFRASYVGAQGSDA